MEIQDFIGLYNKTLEIEVEQKVWEMWLAKYPHMTEETFISYSDMLKASKQSELNSESDDMVDGVYIDQCLI